MDKTKPLLAIGLGNPGKKYTNTRHNIGAHVLKYFAEMLMLTWKNEQSFEGFVAKGMIEGQRVIFLLPQTFMNLSGRSVRKCMDYFDIPLSNVLVLSDDTYLPFGEVKVKAKGSAGGHNGLKDIELCLGTNEYMRMRIGVGEKTTDDLADYVLQEFSKEELMELDSISLCCKSAIDTILVKGEDNFNNKKEDLRRS